MLSGNDEDDKTEKNVDFKARDECGVKRRRVRNKKIVHKLRNRYSKDC